MDMPQIVYLQTTTRCNGHCVYCPFDDVYGDRDPIDMTLDDYTGILQWLKDNNYKDRIGFLLHYEPTMDDRLDDLIDLAREMLPLVTLEAATNGIIKAPVLRRFNKVDTVPAGSRTGGTSRAGNVRDCEQIKSRATLRDAPCPIPGETMCIAANGEVLLCCQDWRHEAVVGTIKDLTAARETQLSMMPKVRNQSLEICRDCMAGRTAEEVGDRLGQRFIFNEVIEDEPEKVEEE